VVRLQIPVWQEVLVVEVLVRHLALLELAVLEILHPQVHHKEVTAVLGLIQHLWVLAEEEELLLLVQPEKILEQAQAVRVLHLQLQVHL
jgi:hypothetical protein